MNDSADRDGEPRDDTRFMKRRWRFAERAPVPESRLAGCLDLHVEETALADN